MSMISFNKSNDPHPPEEVRINTDAVLYAEATQPDQVGKTVLYLQGEAEKGVFLTDAITVVVDKLGGGLMPMTRHYLAGPPAAGASIVFVAPSKVSYARPGTPGAMIGFWVIRFIDGSDVRVLGPLPVGL